MRMRLIDAESLKELFPDNGEGSWTYNATAKVYIDAQPTIHPDTTTHDSIPAETDKNDGVGTSGDCISRQVSLEKIRTLQTYKLFAGDDMILVDKAQVQTELMMLPPVQQEIIRCKDCNHSRFFDPCFYCYEMGEEVIVPENGFCFKAERREDG